MAITAPTKAVPNPTPTTVLIGTPFVTALAALIGDVLDIEDEDNELEVEKVVIVELVLDAEFVDMLRVKELVLEEV
jgi:hypothetical protein